MPNSVKATRLLRAVWHNFNAKAPREMCKICVFTHAEGSSVPSRGGEGQFLCSSALETANSMNFARFLCSFALEMANCMELFLDSSINHGASHLKAWFTHFAWTARFWTEAPREMRNCAKAPRLLHAVWHKFNVKAPREMCKIAFVRTLRVSPRSLLGVEAHFCVVSNDELHGAFSWFQH